MIIMDNVVYPGLKVANNEYIVKPSLLPHTSWLAAMEGAGCTLQVARDLSVD
jgi:hypothetical protein